MIIELTPEQINSRTLRQNDPKIELKYAVEIKPSTLEMIKHHCIDRKIDYIHGMGEGHAGSVTLNTYVRVAKEEDALLINSMFGIHPV
jgi:hypothetical protein